MGILDDLLDIYKEKSGEFGKGVNKYLEDVNTTFQPGMLKDLGGFLKEKVTQYPSGAPTDESTPVLDTVLNSVYNIGNFVVDPNNPAGSIAMAPGAMPSRFRGGPIETIEGVGRPKIPQLPELSTLPEIPHPTIATSKIRRWMESGQADRELTPGEQAKALIRPIKGQTDLENFRETYGLTKPLTQWYKRPLADQIQMIKKIEEKPTHLGEMINIADPVDKDLAYTLGQGHYNREAAIEKFSEADKADYLTSYNRNFLSHMFEDSDQARNLFDAYSTNKKISQGNSFSAPSASELLDEGMNAGLRLKTYNPIEYSILRNADMDRFILAHNIKNKFMENGLVMAKSEGEFIPPNWVKLNDSLFGGKGYYAPPDAAKMFNRYFSPGLQGNKIYDVIKGASNDLNMAQLGMSGFHFLFESMDSIVSDMALAGEQLQRGKFLEAGKSAGRSLSIVGSPISNGIIGDRMMQEALHPGSYSKYAAEVQAMAEAGGRVTMDPIYLNQHLNKFKKAVATGEWSKAIAQSLPAGMEMASKPIMEYYVPRIKLGTFQKLAAQTLEDSKRLGWSDLQTKTALQSAWDSVDNRLGQLVYSNLFWNRTAKDLALIGMRAPGWNLGTVRELGGGVIDLTKQSGRLMADGKFDLTHRMAYTLGLGMMAGYVGGLTHFFMTGKMPAKPVDYYFPGDGTYDQNGNANRINFPSYMKDVLHMAGHPLRTIVSKANPAMSAAVDLYLNKDFYNTEIRHPGDPLVNQSVDLAKYLASELTPFSIRNYKNRAKSTQGAAIGDLVQSLVGITPAPREFVKTKAENLASDFLQRHLPSGPITKEEASRRELKKDLDSQFRRGAIGVKELVEAAGKKQITHDQMENIIKYKNLPTIARDIQMLSPDEAYKVYQAAEPREKQLIAGSVRKILHTELKKTGDPDKRKLLANRMLGMAGKIATNEEDDAKLFY